MICTCIELKRVRVMIAGCEVDYIHTVEVRCESERVPLVPSDFAYVKPDVTERERDELIKLVNEYRECFAKGLGELGCTPLLIVDINEVPGSYPVVCRPYKTSPPDREEIAKIVSEWKQHGLVCETVSPYASTVLLVKQAGCKNRLCVDYYRRLNKQTVRQHYPLPDMQEQLEFLFQGNLLRN